MKGLFFISLLLFTCQAQCQHFYGKKIAKIKENGFVILADTTALKNDLATIVFGRADSIYLDKIEVIKSTTIGDKAEPYYMIVARNFNNKLKVARWLVKNGSNLSFEKQLGPKKVEDEKVFHNTLLLCYGTDDDCYPTVLISDGKTGWSSSTQLMCSLGDCVTIKTLFYEE